MDFLVLIDNRKIHDTLWSEHGFSLLFRADDGLFLLDTGASGHFADNWKILAAGKRQERNPEQEKNPAQKEKKQAEGTFFQETLPAAAGCLILSHGHNDHTGGLRTFLENNPAAPVYISDRVKGMHYYSCRRKPLPDTDYHPADAPLLWGSNPDVPSAFREYRSIGISQVVLAEYGHRIIYLRESRRLTSKVSVVNIRAQQQVPPRWPFPAGNKTLFAEDTPDTFDHELAVAVEDPDGLVILSPCSHNGVLNIIEACLDFAGNRLPVKAFIGGTHLVEYIPGTIEQTRELALTLKERYPRMKLFSGHCTCEPACGIFKEILGDRYETFYSGFYGTV